MDRVLELTEPIRISLEAGPDVLQDLAAGDDVLPFMLQQLSTSTWGYILGEGICLVTRSFTAMALVERHQSEEAVLVLKKIVRTTPQDVTAAFREGCKISATWTSDEAGGTQAGSLSGAVQLWRMLGGEESENTLDQSLFSGQEMPSDSLQTPTMGSASNGGETAPPEEPILPQNEIDRLIATLSNKSGMEYESIDQQPDYMVREAAPGQWPSIQGIESRDQHEPSTLDEEGNHTLDPLPGALDTRIDLAEWTETPNPNAKPPEQVLPNRSIPIPTLRDLVADRVYTVIIFEQREDFDRELMNFRGNFPGTLLSFWDNNQIFLQLGRHQSQVLENYRTKYRARAADLETSITRLRQQEQLLPNLPKYHDQQGSLAIEKENITHQMHSMRMKHILGTYEGRFLARNVFGIEILRQSLLRDLAHHFYAMMRRSTPSFVGQSRFTRRRLKYETVQKQLEESFMSLANLEREAQRRLEYQADWQALLSRQHKIERELEEIGRFVKAAAGIPGGLSADAESLKRWLRSEWESVRQREKLLRAWQECLADEKAWSVRTNDEPVVVLGDHSLLTLPGVAQGAFVVALAQNHPTIMPEAPEGCMEWVMIDPGLRTVDSGKGAGLAGDPLLATISDLAKGMELGTQDALQILGFEDRTTQGME